MVCLNTSYTSVKLRGGGSEVNQEQRDPSRLASRVGKKGSHPRGWARLRIKTQLQEALARMDRQVLKDEVGAQSGAGARPGQNQRRKPLTPFWGKAFNVTRRSPPSGTRLRRAVLCSEEKDVDKREPKKEKVKVDCNREKNKIKWDG